MIDAEIQERLVSAVSSGAAVCLAGAGFSRLASDAYDDPVPSTEDLTTEIKSAFDIAPSEQVNLSEISDFAEEDGQRLTKLRQLLMRRLTVTQPSDEQRLLARLPWRALFTTNFDDVLEQARPASSSIPVTPTTDTKTIPIDKTPIYYMHGRARDLLETDANPSLVISERNYLQLDKRNRDLYARFYNEVFAARSL